MLQARPRTRERITPQSAGGAAIAGASPGAILPYDYAASFQLSGRPGNLVEDVINISAEGVFVATAIGYGLEEERGRAMTVTPVADRPFVPGNIRLAEIPPDALIGGFRVNPAFESLVFASDPLVARREKTWSDQALPNEFTARVFQRLKPAEDISFLLSIIDSSTGREFQDEPTHNLASLGKSNGERPFRLLAQPFAFLPRSTIRLQIVERSEAVQGTLFIVLYGYKLLGAANCPEPVARSLQAAAARPLQAPERPSARIIPFDYVSRIPLSGQPGRIVEDEVSINVEGGFVNTAIGYGLAVEEQDVRLRLQAGDVNNGLVNLNLLSLNRFPPDAASDGFRIRPNFIRIAFTDDVRLTDQLPVDWADRVFERLNRPEDVSFRYTFFDTGTGRELQNQPIHNIAGLGSANGDRPFKNLARPMHFLPRSAIRVTLQEHFGRGTLFLVFQGYKMLGGLPPGGQR
ncbi:MAG: hypothetical protein HUU32_05950 [Calditrichaceae bacterium]|nr:hypothetical protein [Calditrichia bacterium]NUQ40920.1 hypothetical protein [Calditrichaceae bacterium]